MNTRSQTSNRSALSPSADYGSPTSLYSAYASILSLCPLIAEDPDHVQSKPSEDQEARPELSFIEEVTSLSEKAKELKIDTTSLLLYQFLSKKDSSSSQTNQPNPNKPEKLSKVIGHMADNEDIVAFLNRFELELTNRNIPLDNFQSYLPSSLTGQFKEAYYNNLSMCPIYQVIRLVLLNAGGYLWV